MSFWERRAADRRARDRAAARAEALPPPDPGTRLDPISGAVRPGRDVPEPQAPPAEPAATWPGVPSHAGPTPLPSQAWPGDIGHGRPAAQQPPAPPGPAATGWPHGVPVGRSQLPAPSPLRPAEPATSKPPRQPRRGKAARPAKPPRPARSTSQPSLGLRGPWTPLTSGRVVTGSALALVLATAAAILYGSPVLTGAWDWRVVFGCAVIGVAAVAAAARAARWAPGRRSALTCTAALIVSASLVAGALDDPVVVSGRVHLEHSETAQSVRLAEQISADLVAIVEVGPLLEAPIALARANATRYPPARAELATLRDKYGRLAASGDVENVTLRAAAQDVTEAANSAHEALTLKMALLEQEDAAKAEQLENKQAALILSVRTAGEKVEAAMSELGVSYTTWKGGPHE